MKTIAYHFLSARLSHYRSPPNRQLARPPARTRCGLAKGRDKRPLPYKIKVLSYCLIPFFRIGFATLYMSFYMLS
jgi:hypothetical protein